MRLRAILRAGVYIRRVFTKTAGYRQGQGVIAILFNGNIKRSHVSQKQRRLLLADRRRLKP